MPKGIYVRTKKHCRNLSLALKGRKLSEEHRQKVKLSLKGNKRRLGQIISDETRKKLSKAAKGRIGYWKDKKFSEEHKKNVGLSAKGRTPWNKGKYCSEETKRKISQALKGRIYLEDWRKKSSGNNHHNWKGGISKLPYAFEFDYNLKQRIKQRDNYICQKCNVSEKEVKALDSLNRGLSIHHIDYDKSNFSEDNLISLCRRCNTKANYNREEWTKYYIYMILFLFYLLSDIIITTDASDYITADIITPNEAPLSESR